MWRIGGAGSYLLDVKKLETACIQPRSNHYLARTSLDIEIKAWVLLYRGKGV
jgi:hypothetical protein